MESPPSLSLVVPVYNEGALLKETLPEIHAFLEGYHADTELIVSDDGSDEATRKILKEFAASHGAGKSALRLLLPPGHRGKGAAVRDGLLAATKELAGYIDADLQLPVVQVLKLAAALDSAGAEVAIASRRMPGARMAGGSEKRERGFFGRVLNRFVRALFLPGIADTQCGLKLMKRGFVAPILTRCFIEGFLFDVEWLTRARRAGLRIVEVPVEWKYRDRSTVRLFRDGAQALFDLLRLYVQLLCLEKRGTF